jgi:hypothetical protein
MDSDAREDISVTDTVTLIFFHLVHPPLAYIRERRATVTRVGQPTNRTPISRDVGLTPSP